MLNILSNFYIYIYIISYKIIQYATKLDLMRERERERERENLTYTLFYSRIID